MKKLIRIALGATVLLLALAPAALAAAPGRATHAEASPNTADARGLNARGLSASLDGLILAIGEDVVVEEGEHADALVVLGGTAIVRGSVGGLVIVDGTATLESATVNRIFLADGTVNADAGTVVSTAIAEARGQVFAAPGAQLPGIRDMEADAALVAMAIAPVLVLFGLGALVLVYVIGLLVAALGARQVRASGALMMSEPWKALAVGVAASVILPVLAGLLIVTVVGAPIGFALLFAGLPVLAFAGWLVAAIWLGELVLARLGGTTAPTATRHPFRAALLGITLLGLAGLVPLVSAAATMFGTGALLLMAGGGFRNADIPQGTRPADTRPEAPGTSGSGDEQGPLWGPAAPAIS